MYRLQGNRRLIPVYLYLLASDLLLAPCILFLNEKIGYRALLAQLGTLFYTINFQISQYIA